MSNNPAKIHEPLFHIVKRSAIPKWQSWLVRIGSVIAALVICGIVTVLLTGEDPIQVWLTAQSARKDDFGCLHRTRRCPFALPLPLLRLSK